MKYRNGETHNDATYRPGAIIRSKESTSVALTREEIDAAHGTVTEHESAVLSEPWLFDLATVAYIEAVGVQRLELVTIAKHAAQRGFVG